MKEKAFNGHIHDLSNNSVELGDLVFRLRHQIERVLNVGMPVKKSDKEALQDIADKLKAVHSDYCDIIVDIISENETTTGNK